MKTAHEYGHQIGDALAEGRYLQAISLVEQAVADLSQAEPVKNRYPQPLADILTTRAAERAAERLDKDHGIITMDQLLRTPLSVLALTPTVGEIALKEIAELVTEEVGTPLWSCLSPGAHRVLADLGILTAPDLTSVAVEFLDERIYDPNLRREIKVVRREVESDRHGDAAPGAARGPTEEELFPPEEE